MFNWLSFKINLFDRIYANKKYFFKRKRAAKSGDRHGGRSCFGIRIVFLVFCRVFLMIIGSSFKLRELIHILSTLRQR